MSHHHERVTRYAVDFVFWPLVTAGIAIMSGSRFPLVVGGVLVVLGGIGALAAPSRVVPGCTCGRCRR